MQHALHYGLTYESMHHILWNYPNKLFFRDHNGTIIFENNSAIHYLKNDGSKLDCEAVFFACKEAWNAYHEAFIKDNKTFWVIRLQFENETFVLLNRKVFDAKEKLYFVTIVQHETEQIEFKIEDLPDQDHPFIQQSKLGTPLLSNTRSEKLKKILRTCKMAAKSQMPILIQGESGTGKTMLAKEIHLNSPRAKETFLSINCASIPKDLLESELFGYAPHAFTGANEKGKQGLLEVAHNGTLFLDEIGEMPLELQAKILTFVESKTFIPVGSTKQKTVDVRIISATNRPIKEMVQERLFREDLYWRLGQIPVTMPKLAERKEDILPLANSFLNQMNKKNNTDFYIDLQAQNFLLEYHWPGNIRELKNVMQSIAAYCDGHCIGLSAVQKSILSDDTAPKMDAKPRGFHEEMQRLEGNLVRTEFQRYPSSRKLASHLQISQSLANKLIQKYISTEGSVLDDE